LRAIGREKIWRSGFTLYSVTNPTASPIFQLFWLRETGCDAGTPLAVDELPTAIRERVLVLATSDTFAAPPATFALRLPYFDKASERNQEKLLAELPFEREGSLIRAVLPVQAATRDMAATCALLDPLWRGGPKERDAAYFPTWQRVSLALQNWMRAEVARAYFTDIRRFEDRDEAYTMLVYQACRPFFGRPRTDFTYDLRDFPSCLDTVEASWRMTARSIQRVLAAVEIRLREAGKESLARRYAPVWWEDVLVAVKRRPRPYADLLAREAAVINAVIDLGTQPTPPGVHASAKAINQRLRKMHGQDMRDLGCGIFEEATRTLAEYAVNRGQSLVEGGTHEDAGVIPAGRPDLRIAC
jgi:hypothetical protein